MCLFGGGSAIADVRRTWLRIHVTTRYRPRTAVERWHFQDRLRVRLDEVAPDLRPRFYETRDGRLAFSGWTGLRSPAGLKAGLERIDQEVGDTPPPSW